MASLRDFLLKGRLGPVELGMRPEQVEQELGPAEDHSVSTRPVQILKFGSVEVAFKTVPGTDDQRSIAMGVYFGIPGRDLPPRIAFEDWNATENTTEEDARRFLAQAGIGVHSRVDCEIRNLILDPGSSMAFDEGLLRSMHYRRADKRGGRRQMSVSLPEETLKQLRSRAQGENISLQELVERMLNTAV